MVKNQLEEARVGFFEVFGEGEVGFVEQLVELVVAKTQLQVPDVEVVMDNIGVAHQEDPVMFLHFFDGLNALAGDVEEHGVPDGIEFLVGHFLLMEEGFHAFAEGRGGIDARVEFAHDFDKLL